jgi:hypothetical protein
MESGPVTPAVPAGDDPFLFEPVPVLSRSTARAGDVVAESCGCLCSTEACGCNSYCFCNAGGCNCQMVLV